MRHLCLALITAMGLVTNSGATQAADCCCEKPACTDCNPCSDSVPTCKSSWDEKKTKKTERVEFNEKAKAYRLEQLKEVSERMKKIEGERDQMYAEMEEYENEAMKYVREHAPAFLRKELNLL